MLLIEYAKVDADGDGYYDGPDCDDGDEQIHPGAAEQCDDGEDDDCDGEVAKGCGRVIDAGGGGVGGGKAPAAPVGTVLGSNNDGCGCRTGGDGGTGSLIALASVLLLGLGRLTRWRRFLLRTPGYQRAMLRCIGRHLGWTAAVIEPSSNAGSRS